MKILLLLLAGLCSTIPGFARSRTMRMVATAFSIHGFTAQGTTTHRGVAAADPAVLPLGSRILVRGAGAYSGYYVVRDTGGRIRGRKLDLFISNPSAARKFGKRSVSVQVLTRR